MAIVSDFTPMGTARLAAGDDGQFIASNGSDQINTRKALPSGKNDPFRRRSCQRPGVEGERTTFENCRGRLRPMKAKYIGTHGGRREQNSMKVGELCDFKTTTLGRGFVPLVWLLYLCCSNFDGNAGIKPWKKEDPLPLGNEKIRQRDSWLRDSQLQSFTDERFAFKLCRIEYAE
ncbi:hypothetical protein SISNIDRAFT_126783 [Sistotremastrum niveocremeum HHB9708]|uniref:Uncharacterized protein n=1 Tax=Sistotremastrum niveocremeum HHB9708 TaxID=1314777 RepID=A0A164TE86_9AGAM|nr:hypothetical protein SISNIDRAFT_126783 [Sistotremastrum niveocremeum HHB9708]